MTYIKINGEDIPVKFSYRVLRNIKDTQGIDLVDGSAKQSDWFMQIENREKVFFEMIKEGHRQLKKECKFSPDDMLDILSEDNVFADFIIAYGSDVTEFLTPSTNKKKQAEELKEAKEV